MSDKTEDQVQNTELLSNADHRIVNLEYPIQRKDSTISTITLNKPTVGTLRGLSLQSISEFQVDSIVTLLTRITTPTLNKVEIENMEVSDFANISNEVAYFLVSAEAKSQHAQMT